jgi:hypothetical protein
VGAPKAQSFAGCCCCRRFALPLPLPLPLGLARGRTKTKSESEILCWQEEIKTSHALKEERSTSTSWLVVGFVFRFYKHNVERCCYYYYYYY